MKVFLINYFKTLKMSYLTTEEKLKFILDFSKELGITAYDYGENTKLTAVGAGNILTGKSKNPRTKNLNIMLAYLEEKQLALKKIPNANLSGPENAALLDDLIKEKIKMFFNAECEAFKKEITEENIKALNQNKAEIINFIAENYELPNLESRLIKQQLKMNTSKENKKTS